MVKPTLTDKGKDQGSAKATISPEQIIITDPEKQKELEQSGVIRPISEINRDPAKANDVIKGLPDLQSKLNDQLKTQQDWSKASATMATTVRDIADKIAKKANTVKERALWDEGGAGRAALHAIAGALLGGVNGVDGAIKAAIGAGVSTAIAPYINDIVKNAVAQSGLKGEEAKRLSDTLTSSIVSALLASAGGSNGAGYASNEMKYNYLTKDEAQELDRLKMMLKCQGQVCFGTKFDSLTEDEIQQIKSQISNLENLDVTRDAEIATSCGGGNAAGDICKELLEQAWNARDEYEQGPGTLKWSDVYPKEAENLKSVLMGLSEQDIEDIQLAVNIAKSGQRDWETVYEELKLVGAATTIIGAIAGKGKSSGKVWSATRQKTAVENALGHWNKHKSQFPTLNNALQYATAAKKFIDTPPTGTLTKTRSNGEKIFYNPKTNIFVSSTSDGIFKTMFKPKQGMDYWKNQ